MKFRIRIYSLLSLLILTIPMPLTAQGLLPVPPFTGTATGDLISVIINLVDILLTLVGLLASIMIIIGGLRYIVSGGNEEAAAAAKNTILYAIIGLIFVGLSAAIVNFIIGTINVV